MSAQRTARPWTLKHGCVSDNRTHPVEIAKYWPMPGAYQVMFTAPHVGEECDANAAFIVKACNAHDELVDALRVMLEHASEKYPHFESERGQRDIAQASRVLAKVAP